MKRILLILIFAMSSTIGISQTYQEGTVPAGDGYLICKRSYRGFVLQDKDYSANNQTAFAEQQKITENGAYQGNFNKILDHVYVRSNQGILNAFQETFTEEELERIAKDKYMLIIAVVNSKGSIESVSMSIGENSNKTSFEPEKYMSLFKGLKNNVKLHVPAQSPSFFVYNMNVNLENIRDGKLALPETYYRKRSWVK